MEQCMFPDFGFVRLEQILKVVPVSKKTWKRWVDAGIAPQGIRMSTRLTLWLAEDIRIFADDLAKKKGQEPLEPLPF